MSAISCLDSTQRIGDSHQSRRLCPRTIILRHWWQDILIYILLINRQGRISNQCRTIYPSIERGTISGRCIVLRIRINADVQTQFIIQHWMIHRQSYNQRLIIWLFENSLVLFIIDIQQIISLLGTTLYTQIMPMIDRSTSYGFQPICITSKISSRNCSILN